MGVWAAREELRVSDIRRLIPLSSDEEFCPLGERDEECGSWENCSEVSRNSACRPLVIGSTMFSLTQLTKGMFELENEMSSRYKVTKKSSATRKKMTSSNLTRLSAHRHNHLRRINDGAHVRSSLSTSGRPTFS
jgi:hypothetical protein